MAEQDILNKLSVIAKLLAMQITKDMDKENSVWTLKQSGMSNKEIGEFLGISSNAAAAYISTRRKKQEKSQEGGKKKRKENERI
jgi:orotate phosphoribosyltransferase-like protein